ncbi:conserved hypothetical protein [uncultured Gammaproteobacteria bacterium]
MSDIFADTVGRVDFAGGLVRLELSSMFPPDVAEAGKVKIERTGRVVMPLDGFLQTFQAMQNLIDQLVTAGVVNRRKDEPAGANVIAAPTITRQ